MENKSLLLIATFAFVALLQSGAYAYTTQIHAPAVLQNQDMGVLTLLKLNVTSGNGSTTVVGPEFVNETTLSSAQTAAMYAASYLGFNYSKYNFTYSIAGTENVSGPSAGLAFTLLADYGLRGAQLYNNFTVTGTITPDGTVGPVGGVYDKIWAASLGGMNYFLAPEVAQGSSEQLIYYIAQQTFKMPLVEVGNFNSALAYANGVNPATISPIVPNLTQNYNVASISEAPLTCVSCNELYFAELTNFTFGMVNASISGIASNYSALSSQLGSQLATYQNISSKGYLYTGADLAFQEYPYAVTLDNAPAFTNSTTGSQLINDVNSYCSQITGTQMTTENYEYIIGAQLRQAFANINLQGAGSQLNSSESTDDIIGAVDTASASYAWCSASGEMYNIASQIGGAPVVESAALQQAAASAIQNATQYPGLYLQAAQYAYNRSEYSTALYAATYAKTLQNPIYLVNVSNAEIGSISAKSYNATYGVWPTQFADSALFYVQEAQQGGPNAVSYINSAYSLSNLASGLSADNKYISGSLLPQQNVSTNPLILSIVMNQSQQITALQTKVDNAYAIMAFFAVLLIIGWAVLAFLFTRELHRVKQSRAAAKPKRRRSRR